jgi:hypothetical protein
MLSDETIALVAQLLTTPLSQRRVAKITGVSRGTVNAVALGKLVPGRCSDKQNPGRPAPPATFHGGPPAEKATRCPDCGALAIAPCYSCQLRRVNALAKASGLVRVTPLVRRVMLRMTAGG